MGGPVRMVTDFLLYERVGERVVIGEAGSDKRGNRCVWVQCDCSKVNRVRAASLHGSRRCRGCAQSARHDRTIKRLPTSKTRTVRRRIHGLRRPEPGAQRVAPGKPPMIPKPEEGSPPPYDPAEDDLEEMWTCVAMARL